MQHQVKLSNGRVLVIEESNSRLHVGLADGIGDGIDAYVCQIELGGVLVMPNSGDATICLVEGLQATCDACDGSGIRPDSSPHAGPVPEGFTAVERCDTCDKYASDLEAAEAYGVDVFERKSRLGHDVLCRPRRPQSSRGMHPALESLEAFRASGRNCQDLRVLGRVGVAGRIYADNYWIERLDPNTDDERWYTEYGNDVAVGELAVVEAWLFTHLKQGDA